MPMHRTWIVPNGVDRKRFSPADKPGAKSMLRDEFGIHETIPLVLSVGSLRHIKGHDLLIHSIKNLCTENPQLRFHVLIVGEGQLKEKYERLAASLPVSFAGFRSDTEWLYNAADIYCQPSRSEALPNAVIEAMCCGLPIVAADVGGISELVQQKNGKLFPPGAVDILSEHLYKLIIDENLRHKMGEASFKKSARFSNEKMVSQYMQIYSSVLSGKR